MEKFLCFFVLAVCGAHAASLPGSRLPESRIIGGTAASQNDFPYAVSIQQVNQLSQFTRGHRCGGVLISLRHVLTTASCTYEYPNVGDPTPIVPGNYRVFTGSVILTNDSSPEQFRMIVNVTRHPDYTGSPMYVNDIAILTLNNPFTTAVASPLSIPNESFEPVEGAECVTAGWGSQNATATASVNQMFARKVISNRQVCTTQYNLVQGGPNILPSMICATSFNGLTTGCTGDYGNGLVCNGGLAGILSMTTFCQANTYPEVYTRVANYTTWMRSVTAGASTFQPGLAALIVFTVVQLITAKIIS